MVAATTSWWCHDATWCHDHRVCTPYAGAGGGVLPARHLCATCAPSHVAPPAEPRCRPGGAAGDEPMPPPTTAAGTHPSPPSLPPPPQTTHTRTHRLALAVSVPLQGVPTGAAAAPPPAGVLSPPPYPPEISRAPAPAAPPTPRPQRPQARPRRNAAAAPAAAGAAPVRGQQPRELRSLRALAPARQPGRRLLDLPVQGRALPVHVPPQLDALPLCAQRGDGAATGPARLPSCARDVPTGPRGEVAALLGPLSGCGPHQHCVKGPCRCTVWSSGGGEEVCVELLPPRPHCANSVIAPEALPLLWPDCLVLCHAACCAALPYATTDACRARRAPTATPAGSRITCSSSGSTHAGAHCTAGTKGAPGSWVFVYSPVRGGRRGGA